MLFQKLYVGLVYAPAEHAYGMELYSYTAFLSLKAILYSSWNSCYRSSPGEEYSTVSGLRTCQGDPTASQAANYLISYGYLVPHPQWVKLK